MSKLSDISLNVIIPIILGIIIYFIPTDKFSFIQIRIYLPDGLWAYSLTSCILIIWNRKINLLWLLLTVCLFFVFEFFQALDFIKGTYDVNDIYIYLSFSLFAVIINSIFKHKLITKNQTK
jgi:hypothetical protein